ncbi:YoaK family protein [Thalassotalea sp. G2M2-11]|uniref:YoaK family protein n=1 Tax=Thalassotalea sp. G2M2-11 TaxID=2787627 RepID=UPI0019D230AF|nr:YoaK family protein [Thalassotalea sp. G2M2-11]
MISKLPKWIESGAFILAFVAGCINAIGLLGFEHQSVSHVSGTATSLGTSVIDGSWQDIAHLAGVLLSFFFGSSISGFLLHGSTLKLGRHYDTALFVESLLIFAAYYLLSQGSFYGHFAASAACGMQNALATTYSGAIIRTTHLTGIFTDFGIMLGAVFRGQLFDKRKAILFLLIILGFILGGTFGALIFNVLNFKALLIPAFICLLLSVSYRLYSAKQS